MKPLFQMIRKTYQLAENDGSRQVMNNVASLSGLQAITFLLPIVVVPYLFQVIGPEKFGLVAFAQAFVQYFMILTDYAFNITATREISLCQDNKALISEIFSAVMTARLVLTALGLLAFCALVMFVPRFSDDRILYTLTFGTVIGNALFPMWLFQGMEKMEYITKLKMLGEFSAAFGIILFIRGPQDYLTVPLIYASVLLGTGMLALVIAFRKLGLVFKFPGFGRVRQELEAGRELFLSIVAINAYTSTRVFAVGLMTSNTLTGFYSIAERISNVAQTFPLSSFSQAIYPRLSNIYRRNSAMAFRLMQEIQHITIYISLICKINITA